MKHPLMHFVLIELEVFISVTAVVVGVMMVAEWISTGTIQLPFEWLRSTSFSDYILPVLLLTMFAVADYLLRAEFRSHHAHTKHVSHA